MRIPTEVKIGAGILILIIMMTMAGCPPKSRLQLIIENQRLQQQLEEFED